MMTTQKPGFRAASHVVWGGIVLARRVVGVLPVAVLRLVDGKPFVDVGVVAGDDKFGVIEEVVHDAAVGPGAVFGEEGERCVPMEELLGLTRVFGSKEED